jgi:Bacteriophage Sf6, terminase small subunit-like
MPTDRRQYLIYSPEIADELCALLAEGRSLRQITEMPGMPSRRTVTSWLTRYPEFREKYECAMMLLAEFWVHEMLDIADDSAGDYIIDEHGARVVDHEAINRARLRVDTRKWALSKILPKRYGDRVVADITVRGDVKELSNQELLAIAGGGYAGEIEGDSDSDTVH